MLGRRAEILKVRLMEESKRMALIMRVNVTSNANSMECLLIEKQIRDVSVTPRSEREEPVISKIRAAGICIK